MKNHIKKLSIIAMVAAFAATAGGCGKSADRSKDVEYLQTHEDDNVTKVRAKMFLKRAEKKTEIGTIAFSERDTGLRMHVDLKDLRPNREFHVLIYDLNNCDEEKMCPTQKEGKTKKERMAAKSERLASCEKLNERASMPALKTDGKGNIRMNFLITGLTAAELDHSKIVLTRENKNGEEVAVGWGKLKEKKLF